MAAIKLFSPEQERALIAQVNALLAVVAETMPHYQLNAAFAAMLPEELIPYWVDWQNRRNSAVG